MLHLLKYKGLDLINLCVEGYSIWLKAWRKNPFSGALYQLVLTVNFKSHLSKMMQIALLRWIKKFSLKRKVAIQVLAFRDESANSRQIAGPETHLGRFHYKCKKEIKQKSYLSLTLAMDSIPYNKWEWPSPDSSRYIIISYGPKEFQQG